ncbi:MAG: hypothetical protein LUQ65_09090, partial [Candidatus Helarchaeota archaeon]|nr:hypothetical protein [Candidatus Helarchaeota archaeon]
YSQYNWLNPVIRTNNLSPQTLKRLLFRGFFAVDYYGRKKFSILKRAIRSRGLRFIFNMTRIKTGLKSYYSWKDIINMGVFGTTRAQMGFYNNPILD